MQRERERETDIGGNERQKENLARKCNQGLSFRMYVLGRVFYYFSVYYCFSYSTPNYGCAEGLSMTYLFCPSKFILRFKWPKILGPNKCENQNFLRPNLCLCLKFSDRFKITLVYCTVNKYKPLTHPYYSNFIATCFDPLEAMK